MSSARFSKYLSLEFTLAMLFPAPLARGSAENYACLLPARLNNIETSGGTNRVTFVDGTPFITGHFWNPSEGGKTVINVNGLTAAHLYLLGGLNSRDLCHPGWGGGDGFENFFFGTRTGEMKITYASGRMDVIPLVMGYSTWINQPYHVSSAPFDSDTNMARMLDNALCVAHGLRGYEDDPASYYLVIRLRREKLRTITFQDSPDKIGHFEVRGLSFQGVTGGSMPPASTFLVHPGGPTPITIQHWIEKHTINSADGYPPWREEAIAKLRRRFDTQPADINYGTISDAKPTVTTASFPGPKVKFSGSPTAELMTRIYYENADQMLGRIDANGMVHESARGADNFNGIGTWTAGLGPFYDDSYTRIRALTLLSNLGFSGKVNAAVDYYDRWMMYFPEHYPELQLGGKAVPAHATVIANKPLVYFDELRKVGWPTKYKVHDFGNGENDGHGMLMLSRWRAWLKQGKSKSWVDRRWNAIKAAAEYIPWCLAHPTLSFSQHGLLYSESEGGMQKESMFCDLNCYLGLLGSIDMAKSTGRTEWATRWEGVAKAYLASMNAYYTTNISPWGNVWDPNKTASWDYGHATLAPVVIGMDYWGYDVKSKLPPGWESRTLRTYKMQLTSNSPPCVASAGMGYGQSYITEAALLLDQMDDASEMVDWTARLCFAPRLAHPYRVPEGSVVESDGSVWRRWGDLGNLYQLSEVEYIIQVIAGIDDINPHLLVLMPRLPEDWNGIQVGNWPVRTLSRGHSQLVPFSMTVGKNVNQYHVVLRSARAIDHGRIRIGPFGTSLNSIHVICNGKPVAGKLFGSGDSKWVWVDFGDVDAKRIEISAKAL